MTGTHGPEPVGGSPVSPETVADLHGGVLDPATAARTRRAVDADPAATAVYRALESVRGDLAVAAEPYREPDGSIPPVPPAVRARLDQTLAQITDAVPTERTVDAAPATPGRRRTALLVTAAAAVLALGATGIVLGPMRTPVGTPVTEQSAADRAPDETAGDGSGQTRAATYEIDPAALVGDRPTGALADPDLLAACLVANELSADTPVIGAGPGAVDGRDGTVLLVPGDRAPMLTVLVVGPDCGLSGADLLARTTTGG